MTIQKKQLLTTLLCYVFRVGVLKYAKNVYVKVDIYVT